MPVVKEQSSESTDVDSANERIRVVPHARAARVALSVCVPTAKRPEMVARLLRNLAGQTRLPDEILVVDASSDDETAAVVAECQALFAPGVLRHLSSDLGLTLQRNVGIDNTTGELLCMVDDDVLLEPDCLQALEAFMTSPEGQRFGGVGTYITNLYGKPIHQYQRLYRRLALWESLTPGVWLYCGDFVPLNKLPPFTGVCEVQYLSGCAIMWRRAVFARVRPDSSFRFGGEDRHLSLRVSQHWPIGVLGHARVQHDHWPEGVRRHPFAQAIRSMRNRAIILRQCDAKPSWRRYVAHQLYQWLDLSRLTLSCLALGRWIELRKVAGSWIGWIWNTVAPPLRRASWHQGADRQASRPLEERRPS